jgi:hypothetical protein
VGGGGERREETGMTRFLWMPRSGPADSNRDYGCDSAALSLGHGCLFLIRTLYTSIPSRRSPMESGPNHCCNLALPKRVQRDPVHLQLPGALWVALRSTHDITLRSHISSCNSLPA